MNEQEEDLLKLTIQNLIGTVAKLNDSNERLTRLIGSMELRIKKLELGDNKPKLLRV